MASRDWDKSISAFYRQLQTIEPLPSGLPNFLGMPLKSTSYWRAKTQTQGSMRMYFKISTGQSTSVKRPAAFYMKYSE